jgi:hypothetical protein
MSVRHIASPQPSRTRWVNRLVIALVVIASLFAPFIPEPTMASTSDVVVTAQVFLNPLEVRASAPSKVKMNTIFTVKAVIRNSGELSLENAEVVIHLPKDVELVGPSKKIKLGTIKAQKNATATWQVRAKKKGNYAILTSASGRYKGTIVTGEDAVLVAVTAR